MLPKLLNGKEVAEFLHISKGLAYRLMAQGDIPTVRFSLKTTRVKEDDLLKWIEAHANVGNDGDHPETQI
jgi:excisionase family DNA binding protein